MVSIRPLVLGIGLVLLFCAGPTLARPELDSVDAGTAAVTARGIDTTLDEEVTILNAHAKNAPSASYSSLDYELLPTSATASSAADSLAGMSPELKSNADVQIELIGDYGLAALHQAAQVEDLWSEGRHTEAIIALEALERTGVSTGAVVNWRQPIVSSSPKWYTDVRIGSPRAGVNDIAMDYNDETGNLFVLATWPLGVTLNMSTDSGASWVETAALWTGSYSLKADITVSGDFVWMGYVFDVDGYATPRMRRFHVDSGTVDGTYNGTGWVEITDEGPNSVRQIAVVGDTPDYNSRIYLAYLVNETDEIKFWWDTLSGTSFSEISPGINNAAAGLDMTYNPWGQLGHTRWISYIGTDNKVHIYRSTGTAWNHEVSFEFTGDRLTTSLTAIRDKIYCAFEGAGSEGIAVMYLQSIDSGHTGWAIDYAYSPSAGQSDAMGPSISARSGHGPAIAFNTDETPEDNVYHARRRGHTYFGDWDPPQRFSSMDASWGRQTVIEWLGARCTMSYGLIYVADGDPSSGELTPWFDVMTSRCFMYDGFESGDLSGWDVSP